MTLHELLQSSLRVRKDRTILPEQKITLTHMTLETEAHTLLIEASITGSEREPYTTQIHFLDVHLTPHTFQDAVEIHVPQKGTQPEHSVLLRRLRANTTQVRVSCTCQDYVHTYAFHNATHEAHEGIIPHYVRKTTDHRSQNPQKLPGLCKHLRSLIAVLRQRNMLIH